MNYLLLAAVVLLINLAPAFAPPTWAVLVVFRLYWHLQLWPLVLVGALAASSGRTLLALGFNRLSGRLPRVYVRNVKAAGELAFARKRHAFAIIGLFLISPLPSAQLFEAAGLMGVRLRPIVAAFFVGRLVTYTAYAAGASAVRETSFGNLLANTLRSPWGWALQGLSVLAIVLLGRIDWRRFLKAE